MAPDEEAANAELEGQGGRLAWLEAEMDGLPVPTWILIGLGIAIVVLGVGAWWTYRGPGTQADQAMSGGAMQIQVIALRYVEELTLAEIASILRCSKESVNTHLRRARATLARRLQLEEDA